MSTYSSYTVGSYLGGTPPRHDFESLALQYYGDASYAPFIAEANGYSDDSQVAFGQTLQLPQLVRCKNNARTHSPYFIFANALINHFAIHLVTCQPPPPPPPPQDDDDSFFGDIVDAFEDVCAVVVGIAVGVASGGTLAPVIVGAMVAAATDAAAQVVNMAVGIQSKFSFQREDYKMKVLCRKIISRITGKDLGGESPFLIKDKEYVVLCVNYVEGYGIDIYVQTENHREPRFIKIDGFEFINQKTPASWVTVFSDFHGKKVMTMLPKSWDYDSFFEDISEEEPKAIALFNKETEIMYVEEGLYKTMLEE